MISLKCCMYMQTRIILLINHALYFFSPWSLLCWQLQKRYRPFSSYFVAVLHSLLYSVSSTWCFLCYSMVFLCRSLSLPLFLDQQAAVRTRMRFKRPIHWRFFQEVMSSFVGDSPVLTIIITFVTLSYVLSYVVFKVYRRCCIITPKASSQSYLNFLFPFSIKVPLVLAVKCFTLK